MFDFNFSLKQIKKIFLCKINLFPPKKTDILIFDKVGSEIILDTIPRNKTCSILDLRYESLNLFILLKTLKHITNLKRNYIIEYIKFVSPKMVITTIDTNPLFFKLKKKFSFTKFISIQNGLIQNNFLKSEKKKNLKVDYILCFNNFFKYFYSNKINAKVIPIGSIKNNKVPNISKKKGKILFISEYSNSKAYSPKYKTTNSIIWNNPQEFILKILDEYCKKNHISYSILLKPLQNISLNEINYYKNLKKKNKLNFSFKQGKNIFDQYKICDSFNLIITLDSTLGYENIARHNKTFFLPIRKKFFKAKNDIWIWNIKKYNKSFIWEDNLDKNIIKSKLDKVFRIKNIKYFKMLGPKFKKNIFYYDKHNLIIKQLIKDQIR